MSNKDYAVMFPSQDAKGEEKYIIVRGFTEESANSCANSLRQMSWGKNTVVLPNKF